MVARTSAPDKHMVRGHSLVPSVAHTFHLAQSAWQRKKGKADLYEAFDGNSDRRTLTLVLTMYTSPYAEVEVIVAIEKNE